MPPWIDFSASMRPDKSLADPAEGIGELRRDDEHLVRRAVRELRQRLQVLVGQQLLVGVAGVDRVEHLLIALASPSARRIAACVSPSARQDRGLLLALGGEDLRLLDALGVEDRGAAVPLGAHLLLHRLLDVRRRVDRLELDPVDADAPLAGRLVEHAAQLRC